MKPIDPLQLQRLVDGELDENQVQQILANAKVNPDQWQEIAVGFVENQTWSRAFKNRDSSEEASSRNENGSTSGSALGSPARAFDHPLAKTENSRRPTNHSWWVLAACVMVAATIGYMASEIQNRNLPGSTLVDNMPSVSSPLLATDNATGGARPGNGTPTPRPQMTQADYHLEVPQEHLGELGSAGPVAPVPLFTVNNVEQLKRLNQQRNTPAISPEMLKQLTGSGYQMEQDINYISGRLGDGRSFVVPVRTIRFIPGQ